MSIEEKRRELFERIATRSGWSIAPKQDRLRGILEPRQYHSSAVQMAWEGFNIALDAVVIELPIPEEFDGYYNSGLAIRKDAVIAAIEATGLGLKVTP